MEFGIGLPDTGMNLRGAAFPYSLMLIVENLGCHEDVS
jgi:hypothetical protein